jgi:hypothetical protein
MGGIGANEPLPSGMQFLLKTMTPKMKGASQTGKAS